jgi:hypothetical protein
MFKVGKYRGIYWYFDCVVQEVVPKIFAADISGQHIVLTFRGQAVQEDGTDSSSRNVGNALPVYAA